MYSYIPYRIPFSETDAMGIVHHSNYPRYFERGRVEFLRQVGISYQELANGGVHFPVLNIECQFRKSLRFDDLVAIESRISSLTKTRLCFQYRIIRCEAEPKSEMSPTEWNTRVDVASLGSSEHCCLGVDQKPQRIPDELFAILAKYYQKGIAG